MKFPSKHHPHHNHMPQWLKNKAFFQCQALTVSSVPLCHARKSLVSPSIFFQHAGCVLSKRDKAPSDLMNITVLREFAMLLWLRVRSVFLCCCCERCTHEWVAGGRTRHAWIRTLCGGGNLTRCSWDQQSAWWNHNAVRSVVGKNIPELRGDSLLGDHPPPPTRLNLDHL